MAAFYPPPGVRVLSVGELTREIKSVLTEGFAGVWVVGEISNLVKHSSGHWYFSLKDTEASLSVCLFRGVNARVKFDVHNGLSVIAFGRLDVYATRGQYNLIVEQIQPKGIGALELAFRQLKEKLTALGFFEPSRKKSIPATPLRIGIVTSATGSAIRDMLETLGRRWPAVEVWVRAVRVQGDGAALEIAEAIALLNRVGGPESRSPIDVLLVGRGGGSLEDLWAFNEEAVAQAIFDSLIPLVTGIGHEDDYTIADMVADLRGLTPTDAASKVVPDRTERLQIVGDLESRLRGSLLRRLEQAREKLADLAGRRCFRAPLDRIREEERRIEEQQERLDRAMRQRLEQIRQHIAAAAGRLESLSPLHVLGRGYSLTRKEQGGAVVRDAEQVRPGERLVTILQRGQIVSRVEETAPADGAEQRTAFPGPHPKAGGLNPTDGPAS